MPGCAKGSYFAFHSGTAVSDWTALVHSPWLPLGPADPPATTSLAPGYQHVPSLQPYISIIYLWPDASTIPGISLTGINGNSDVRRGQKGNCQLKFCTEGLVLLLPKFTHKESVALEEPSLCKRSHAAKNQDGRDLLLAADKLCSSQTLPDFMKKYLSLLPINHVTALFLQLSQCFWGPPDQFAVQTSCKPDITTKFYPPSKSTR